MTKTGKNALCTLVTSGEVSEWFKEAVLKTVVGNSHRGFESYLLRQKQERRCA